MITLKELKDYATKKKLKIEIEYPHSYVGKWNRDEHIDRYNSKTLSNTTIGFQLKKGVYYWWEGIGDDFIFDHRYNMINGATQKTFNRGYKAETEIRNFLSS